MLRKRGLATAAAALVLGCSVQAHAFEITPEARLDLDYAAYNEDHSTLADGWLVRRARFGVEGQQGNWEFELGYDFTDDGELKDARVTYRDWPAGELTLGQFKVPFGLERQTSSRNIAFIERSLVTNALAPSRRMGMGFEHQGNRYTVAAMAFGSDAEGGDRAGAGARITFAPLLEKDRRVLHFGVAASTEHVGDSVKLGTRPEARPADEKLVKTPRLHDVNRITRVGLETAWQRGSVSVQGEWMGARLQRDSGQPNLNFDGWYVGASWFVTGEVHRYRDGRFKSTHVDRSGGAWELTARYSRVNLNDHATIGGRERNLSVGANWYVNESLRLMLNYIDVHSQRRGVADNPGIVLVRAQLNF